MALSSASLIDALQAGPVLSPAQLQEARQTLAPRFGDAQALAQELVRRGWLTVFQAKQLLQGRGAQLVLGPYVLLDGLGIGGAGQVFKARHVKQGRVVALKTLRPELLKDKEVVQRFKREIEVAAQVAHPNIVQAYEAGTIGSLLVLVMEYVEGTNLEYLVAKGGPLPAMQACEYIRQAAVGLQHAYEHGLVHRDIKPSNLLLAKAKNHSLQAKPDPAGTPRDHGTIKILDMGLARIEQPAMDSATANLTVKAGKQVMQGTPDYMAPEQALDFHAADIRSDIYSLGCTLFFLLAGEPPFAAKTLAEKLLKHHTAEPPVAKLKLPPGLDGVLRKLMAKSADDRFQTPADVAAALAPHCPVSAAATSWELKADTLLQHLGDTQFNSKMPTKTKRASVVLLVGKTGIRKTVTAVRTTVGWWRRRSGRQKGYLLGVAGAGLGLCLLFVLWPGSFERSASTEQTVVRAGPKAPTGKTEWVPLKPKDLTSNFNATFTVQPDLSVFVSGPNEKGTYVMTAETELLGITGIRLEVFADERLPSKGPGRAQNGNFVLSELGLVAAPSGTPLQVKSIGLQRAQASHNQGNLDIVQAIDGKTGEDKGWAILPMVGNDLWATFETSEDVGFAGGTLLKFIMDQQYGDGKHGIGRFRFLATAAPRPIPAGLPIALLGKITAYKEAFAGPNPAPGWQYLWNAKGPIGNPANYQPLKWHGSLYNVDGQPRVPGPDPGAYIQLGPLGGHPGRGASQSKIDYFAIAAYTLQPSDGAGTYRLVRSALGKGNGLEVVIHVNNQPALFSRKVPANPNPPAGFNANLGQLKPGDTIYVAIGPDGSDGSDGFTGFDFTIARD